MVQMSRRSVQKPAGRTCGCCKTFFLMVSALILFCGVILVTDSISNDSSGIKHRFHLPWKDGDITKHRLFPKNVFTRHKKAKSHKNNKSMSTTINKDRTMILEKQDYSNIGGPQVNDKKPKEESNKPTVLVKNFTLDPPAKEETKKTDSKSAKKEEPTPAKKGQSKPKGSSVEKPKENKEEAREAKKKKKQSKKSGRTEPKGVAKKGQPKEPKGSSNQKKSKKVAPTIMEGQDLVSAAETMTKKKSSGDAKKLSKKSANKTTTTKNNKNMSGATDAKKNDAKKPKEGPNKKGTKKVGEKKMSEGLEGSNVATKKS